MTTFYDHDGLLYTELTVRELDALRQTEGQTVAPWFCGFGHYDPDFVERRLAFEAIGIDAAPGEFLSEDDEAAVLREMRHLLWGPIDETPAPKVGPKQWAGWVLYQLTKHGDHPPLDMEDEETEA